MKLSYLLQDLGIPLSTEKASVEIQEIVYDSRKVKPGCLFVAIRGFASDGHDYIAQAFQKGAVVVLCEKKSSEDPAEIIVPDTRLALAQISARFFGEPSEKMKVIGITGTNGKTTLTYLLEAIFKQARFSPAVLGTINYRYSGFEQAASHTTPESYEIQSFLTQASKNKVQVALLEVSSHALDLKRVDGLSFDGAVFTNLSSEHLDYHHTMEEYFAAKKRLFEELLLHSKKKKKFAVLNQDDPWVKKLSFSNSEIALYYFSLSSENKAEIYPTAADFNLGGIQACVQTPWGACAFHSPLIGTHNLQNLLAAIGVAGACGIDLSIVSQALTNFSQVPGRLERVVNEKGVFVFVDYAHTPDALKQVTTALSRLKGQNRLGVVFGCGGDRDKTKRPLMAQEVSEHADFAVVTNDNPRTEDPGEIINQILPGFEKSGWKNEKKFWIEPDREKAIAFALSRLQKGDVLLIAGKGHEDYQIVGKAKYPFNDIKIAEKYLEKSL